MTWKDTLWATVVILAWGFNFVVVKIGMAELPPLLLTTLRLALVAVMVVPFTHRPRGKLGLIALLALLLGAGHFGLLFIAMRTMDAASASIAIQLTVPFSALLAALLYGEKLGLRGILGMAMAYAGVALLAGEPHHPDLFSMLLIVLSAACWALANVVIKRIGPIHPLTLTGWMALAGFPQLLILSFLFEDHQMQWIRNAGWMGWGAVAYTAVIASMLAYSLWCWLIAKYPVNKVVPFTLLNPVIGIASGVLVLGEPLGWHKLVGGGLTVLGVAVIQIRLLRLFVRMRRI
ncbi:MAG TPA: EamA family transporter [Telmatospirillum sp.]|nr:EamA family transporter [Telmatospirillum sp.]